MTAASTIGRRTPTVAAAFLLALVALKADDPPGQTEPPVTNERAPRASDDVTPEDPEPTDTAGPRIATEPRDAIDASAPHSADMAKLLRRAESLLADRNWPRARDTLRYVVENSNGSVVRLDGGRLVSVADVASDLFRRLPADMLDLYRRENELAAEKALAEAIETGRAERIEFVATQFRLTAAGRQAVARLAAIHFDRGAFGLAARLYRELRDAGDALDLPTRVRATRAFVLAGDDQSARELLADLTEQNRKALAASLPGGFDRERLLARPAESSAPPVLSDWPMPFGDPTRAALGATGEPLLLRRWFRPLADRAQVREQVSRIALDLRDLGRAAIPASLPLAVGDRVIARTLRGVAVYSAADGTLLWETDEGLSPERLLSGDDGPRLDAETRQAMRFRFQFGPVPSRGGSADQNPLAGLLYRDGVNGFVSADAERLYVIEDHAALVPSSRDPFGVADEADALGHDRAANRLAAYDLDTGRPAWPQGGVGGGVTGGPFERPLAGYYFFGPPTPVGDDLYAVGEKDKEIHLVALDPATGGPRWERLIAHAPAGIDQDLVRRAWPAQVAASGGILVCPTTVGWLVGVDQSTHSILWAYRYAPPQPGRNEGEAGAVAQASILSARWSPSAPVLCGNRIVCTPSEEARLVCLDLATGEPLWQHGKGGAAYVAGVAGDLIVTVGQTEVAGLDLETGGARWTVPLGDDAGLPSGRGVLTADRLYLPLRGDLLRTIDVGKGEVVSDLALPPGDGTLGNLLLRRGTLISCSTDGVTAFEERTVLARTVEERLEADARDPTALLRQAELLAADGDLTGAAKAVDQADAKSLSGESKEDLHQLKWRILSELVRKNGDDADRRLTELSALAVTPDERLAARRLEAERTLAAGDRRHAARVCLTLLDDGSLDRFVAEGDRTSVRLSAWLAGRFADLWSSNDEPTKSLLADAIRARFDKAGDDAERDRLVRLFAFHPQAAAIARDLAAKDVEAGRLAEAEVRLLRLPHGDEPAAAQTDLALAQVSEKAHHPADAAAWLDETQRFDAATALPDGTSLAEARDRLRQSIGSPPGAAAPDWGDFRLNTVRSGAYMQSDVSGEVRVEPAAAPLLPYFRDRQFRLLMQQDRLAVSGPGGAGLEQLVPLRVGTRSGPTVIASAEGHLLYVLYRNVAQLVSPAEGRVVWSVPLPEEGVGIFAQPTPPASMRPAGTFAASGGLVGRARTNEPMPAAGAGYVLLRGRRELTCLDAATGETVWKRRDLPRDVAVIGTDDVVYVLPRGTGGKPLALRSIDGREVDRRPAFDRLRYAVAAVGDRLLTVTSEQTFEFFGQRIGRSVVSLYDPATNAAVWTRAFRPNALFDLTEDRRLCVLEPDGKLSTIDPATGEPSPLGAVPPEVLQRRNEAYLLTDATAAYVIVNTGRGGGLYYPAEIPAVPVSGEVFAFDRTSGDLRWRRTVSDLRLFVQEFDQSPVLLFHNTEMTQKGNRPYWRVDLLALDKRTGEPLLDEASYAGSTPYFRGLTVDPEHRSLELGSFNTRLRLQAVPKEAAAKAEPTSG